tara:strand:+ start:401 stop:685 length:285 start_codon:yes stop_codon:yes gene_type:complete
MAANNIRKFKRNDASYGEGNVKGHPDWAKNKKNRSKLAAANNIRSLTESGFGLNIPLSDWKDIPPGIKNDPDFIKLRLKRLKAKKNGKSKRRKV